MTLLNSVIYTLDTDTSKNAATKVPLPQEYECENDYHDN